MDSWMWFVAGGVVVFALLLWWGINGAPSISRLFKWIEREWEEIKNMLRRGK